MNDKGHLICKSVSHRFSCTTCRTRLRMFDCDLLAGSSVKHNVLAARGERKNDFIVRLPSHYIAGDVTVLYSNELCFSTRQNNFLLIPSQPLSISVYLPVSLSLDINLLALCLHVYISISTFLSS